LLELIEAGLHDVRGPLLLLATARPEFVPHRDGDVLRLEALSPSDASRMIEALIPAVLPAAVRSLVIDRAEGNPFFVEELVRTLIDQGVLERQNGSWTVRELSGEFVVPDTVQAVLAARIDLLTPADKAGLQAAAVIGRIFWSGPLYELMENIEPDLRVLEERDFIRHRTGSSLLGEREFVIKHALTREVAYRSLPTVKRARLHARFARWLERAGEGRDEHAALLAHHYAQAVSPEDVDLAWPGDEDELERLRKLAVSWLRRAAELAEGRYEIEDAVSLLSQAAELEADPSALVEIWRDIGHAYVISYNAVAFAAAMEHAIELSSDELTMAELYAELAFQAIARTGMWGIAPERAVVEGWVAGALEFASSGSATQAKVLVARSYLNPDTSSESAIEAIRIAEELGDPAFVSYAFDAQSLSAFTASAYRKALELQRRRVALIDVIYDPDHRADIYFSATGPAVACGHFEEARRYADSLAEIVRELSPHHRFHGAAVQVLLEELLGDWDAVRRLQPQLEEALAHNAGTPCALEGRTLLACALACVYHGDDKDARRLELEATAHTMLGYERVQDARRMQLALHRNDLDTVASMLGEPSERPKNWAYLGAVATRLDALAALGDRARVESLASECLQPDTYLEPFALRALGLVREDVALVERALGRFERFGLEWHAGRTRALLSSFQ